MSSKIKKIGCLEIINPETEELVTFGRIEIPSENAKIGEVMGEIKKAFFNLYENLNGDEQFEIYQYAKKFLENKEIYFTPESSSTKVIEFLFDYPLETVDITDDFYDYKPLNLGNNTLIFVHVE